VAGPSSLADAFAAVMVLTAAYCASRFVTSRRRGRAIEFDTDAMHAAMGVAMAGMLTGLLSLRSYRVWEALFGFGAIWFGWRTVQAALRARGRNRVAGHHLQHFVACGVMLYMFAAMPRSGSSGSSMSAMSTTGAMGSAPGARLVVPMLAWLFAIVLYCYAGAHVNRLLVSGAGAAPGAIGTFDHTTSASAPSLAPRLATVCQIAMCVTMGYMLIATSAP
jgi:hypothetical protein